ncbi:MAG: metal ABC transporter permease, partial [Acidobacteriota bacterium]
IAAAIGVVSGVSGSVISSSVPRMPTGPTIVLILSLIVVVSLFMAPRRGLLWRYFRFSNLHAAPDLDPVLMHLYALSRQHPGDPEHGHSVAVIRTMSPLDAKVDAALERLADRGLAQRTVDGGWAPTAIGRREAQRILDRETREEGR